MLGAVGAIAGSLLGPLIGYHGQQETNRSNETMANNATAANMMEADRNRTFQAEQAATARDFEERMSNTAYQRAATDMKAAGINPILMANSGASTPNASAPSGSQGSAVAATSQNPAAHLTGVFSSALDAMKTLGELDLQTAQAGLIKAQTQKTGIESEVAKKDIPKSELINEGYDFVRKFLRRIRSGDETSAKSRQNMQKLLRSTRP